jgi:hypothetical protein
VGQKWPNWALLDRNRTIKIDGCASISRDQNPVAVLPRKP